MCRAVKASRFDCCEGRDPWAHPLHGSHWLSALPSVRGPGTHAGARDSEDSQRRCRRRLYSCPTALRCCCCCRCLCSVVTSRARFRVAQLVIAKISCVSCTALLAIADTARRTPPPSISSVPVSEAGFLPTAATAATTATRRIQSSSQFACVRRSPLCTRTGWSEAAWTRQEPTQSRRPTRTMSCIRARDAER